jgi:putative salt-induced outer membrane protein YdiY
MPEDRMFRGPKLFLIAIAISCAPAARAELHNESEVGVVITSGNTRTQSLSFKQQNRYDWLKNAFAFNGSFLQTKNAGVLTAKRWDLQLRYERKVEDDLSLLLAQGVQSDRFAGYLQRLNTDFGPRYVVLREQDVLEWAAELTYRFSREIKVTGVRDYRQQGRIFTEVKRNWSATASSRFWVEFIPSFRNLADWELRSEISTSAAFNSIFSMKAAYLLKYDNVPATAAALKRDTEFTTALVAKF